MILMGWLGHKTSTQTNKRNHKHTFLRITKNKKNVLFLLEKKMFFWELELLMYIELFGD